MSPEEEHYFFGEGQHENDGCGPWLVVAGFILVLLLVLFLFR